MVTEDKLKLGDLVKPAKDMRHDSNPHAKGLGLIVDIGVHSIYEEAQNPSRKVWLAYTILWSETGNKSKHFTTQLVKVTGKEIWVE